MRISDWSSDVCASDLYIAWLFGIGLTPWTMAVGLAVAVAAALSSVSLPGSISFVTSIAPIAVSMGVPVAPLALLVAVETFPDIFRTIGTVVADEIGRASCRERVCNDG